MTLLNLEQKEFYYILEYKLSIQTLYTRSNKNVLVIDSIQNSYKTLNIENSIRFIFLKTL